MKETKFKLEQDFSTRQLQNKRKPAEYEKCKEELEEDFTFLLAAFAEALKNTNHTLSKFSTVDWSRTLEASVIQSSLSAALSKVYKDKVCYAKHKRLVLRLKGYLILFKKLDKNGFPMNIETESSLAILNQSQQLELFSESNYNSLPILFFGYNKNRIGQFVSPRLIYIDNEKIQFSINERDFSNDISTTNNLFADIVDKPIDTKPTLKKSNKQKENE